MISTQDRSQFIAMRIAQSAANFAVVYGREPEAHELPALVTAWRDAACSTWNRNESREKKRMRQTRYLDDLTNEPCYEETGFRELEVTDSLRATTLDPIHREILTMLLEGYSQREIASALQLSEDSVNRAIRTVRRALMEKNVL